MLVTSKEFNISSRLTSLGCTTSSVVVSVLGLTFFTLGLAVSALGFVLGFAFFASCIAVMSFTIVCRYFSTSNNLFFNSALFTGSLVSAMSFIKLFLSLATSS